MAHTRPAGVRTAADETTPVLIVGGGYAGLACSLFLSHHGVRSVLVDHHPGPSVQGRARGINQRTMEIYRPLGIEPMVREAGRPFDRESGVVRCERLASEWTWILADDSRRPLPELTAGEFGMADQSTVEPILIQAAARRGADIRFHTRCLAVEADGDGVTAMAEDRRTGRRQAIRCDYLVAADGFRGTIRRRVGIDHIGPGVTQHWVTFIIEADLSGIVRKRAMFWIVVNDEIGFGSFLTTAVPDRWAVSVTYDPRRATAASFTPERCAEVARAVIGEEVPLRVVDIASWEEAVGVAERFGADRVFLTGDAAHVWPPAGAMGANAAVQDAHNLAWKLAAVTAGWAGRRLLDSYEAERRPVALALADITVRRQQARFGDHPDRDDVDDILCTLGQQYRSAAVIGARHRGVFGNELPRAVATGARAPHLWLDHGGERIAMHDLFHDAFVLLTGADGEAWQHAAGQVAGRHRLPLRAYRVGPGGPGVDLVDIENSWHARYGIGADGAVLVRPDGYVCWRRDRPGGAHVALLTRILRELLALPASA